MIYCLYRRAEAMSSNSAAPMELPELITLSVGSKICARLQRRVDVSRVIGFLVMIAPDYSD